ncbi:MAG: alpha-2-macroglobulin domain protein 2, partial [Deltaproteobacteria bacterium]|nr:alpha-2-macroglobulin domain protein 2 [Deltaproteobacteria bacterium]
RKMAFKVRPSFTVVFRCDRERQGGDCLPILPMRLDFSAPVDRSLASRIVLRAADGTARAPVLPDDMPGDPFVSGAVFEGPFPEKSRFHIEIPAGLADDAGRTPANRGKFPLAVATGAFPPLAKFPAPFGIVELRGDAALPLTVRNIEARATGRIYELREGREERIVDWLRKVDRAEERREGRSVPLLADMKEATEFAVPKPGGEKAFEVVGIPFSRPGFYVVEIGSERLGKSLLDGKGTMHVAAAALVTNLAAHLKRGRESSLVWVTTLDRGEPVEGADVAVRDPKGLVLWEGKTGADGVARIREALPDPGHSEGCSPYCGLYATARKGDDLTFVFSEWQEGIEPYRFRVPTSYRADPAIAHTVFDRTLFQAGETVRMKHFLRRHALDGLFYGVFLREKAPAAKGARTAVGGYTEGDEEYAHMGRGDRYAGSFRVEEYRVPLMKGSVNLVGEPRANAREVELDLLVSYLSGGGAGGTAVRLRTDVSPRAVSFAGYGDFVFSNGRVVEGISRREGDESEAWDEEDEARTEEGAAPGKSSVRTRDLVLDAHGALRTKVTGIARSLASRDLVAELEYSDPNGEIQAVSTRVPLWPSRVLLGIKPDSWAASKEAFKFHIAALDLSGAPVKDAAVAVDLFQRKSYTHRKRLLGGVYAYEHTEEIVKIGALCKGATDKLGLLACETKSPVSGNVILQASAADAEGNASFAHRDVWVAGKDDWWFDVSSQDRIDLLPEKRRYEPGETAVFQVRMPFREATALVTVEREGIADVYVRKLSGKSPVVEIPVKPYHAPNVYVSVLCVRGRAADAAPTATVDLGKPAFKLGIAGIDVGWKVHEMKVEVKPEHDVYRVREKAKVTVRAARADGGPLPKGTEVVVAAVDEGLLELAPNASWNLLEAMMRRRSYEVSTSTAQMQVVGKRHYGLKSQPQGGGGAMRAMA